MIRFVDNEPIAAKKSERVAQQSKPEEAPAKLEIAAKKPRSKAAGKAR